MASPRMLTVSVKTVIYSLILQGLVQAAHVRRGLQSCVTVTSNQAVHIVSKHSNLVLKANSDNNVVQSYASAGKSDDWEFVSSGGGLYRVIAEGTNKALIVAGGGQDNGVGIQVSTESFLDGRDKWCIIETEAGVYQLKNAKSGLVVDVANFSTGDGDKIHQWNYVGGTNQVWSFDTNIDSDNVPSWECAGFPQNTFYHIIAQHSGMALAVADESTQSGANVYQYPVAPTLNDNWRMVPTEHGFVHLIAQHSGMALSVTGNDNGANVVQAAPSANIMDDWCFIPQGKGLYEVRNRQSSKSLDVAEYSSQIGGNVHQWTHWGGANQKFYVDLVENNNPLPTPSPPSPSPPGPTQAYSDWEGPVDTPIVAVAAANLPDGRILMWSSLARNFFQGGDRGTETWTATYNPNTGSVTEKLVKTNHDMFCPGTSSLSDGVLMITGGSNSESTTFYDYRNDNWSVGPKLKIPRGYHSHTVLADNSVFTLGGSWSGSSGPKDGEVWSPSTNSWRELTDALSEPMETNDSAGTYRSDNHYWLFLAPNGKVFHAGPSKQMHWITTSGSGSIQNSVVRGDDDDAMNGNALIYDIGKFLTIGGAKDYDAGSGSNRAYIIDINGSEATVKRTGDMSYKRTLMNSVVLPSGEVIVVGGQTQVKLFSDELAVYHAEIWDPETGKFTVLQPMKVPRTYHSVSLLMKDGRVWAAGGGLCGGCNANHLDFEILTPPYLFDSDGSLATRPVIQSAPSSVKAGSTFTVQMNSNQAHTFAVVRTSAVTHCVNTDQRRIPLQVANKSDSSFSLKIPSNKNVALTGVYYLFAMNANGVPSIAKNIQIAL